MPWRRCSSSRSRAATPRSGCRARPASRGRASRCSASRTPGRPARCRPASRARSRSPTNRRPSRRAPRSVQLAGPHGRQHGDELVVAGIEPPAVVYPELRLAGRLRQLDRGVRLDDGQLPRLPRQRGHLPEPARRVHRRRPAPVRLRDQHGQRRPHDRLARLGHRRLVPRPRRDPARFRPPVQRLDLGPRHDGTVRPGLDRQLADHRQRRQPGERHDQRRRLAALLRQEFRRQLHRRARRIRHPDA